MHQIKCVELPEVEQAIDQIIAFLWQGVTDPAIVHVLERELRRILVDLVTKENHAPRS